MILSAPQTQTLKLHMISKQIEAGQVVASVVEMPDCRVTAATQEEAIALLQAIVQDRLVGRDLISFEVPMNVRVERENPWIEFIGMYEEDADFAEVAADLRRERGFD